MKFKNYILFLLLLGSFSFTIAQGQLTEGIQTTSLLAFSERMTTSTSDINANYFAIASWNSEPSICGNYLRIYDAITFNPTSPVIQISTYHQFTRIRIDNEDNIYVLYHDKPTSTSTNIYTYIKKYDVTGTQIGPRVMVANNTKLSDIEVAPNGDVLIGCLSGNVVLLKIYRNMVYEGIKFLGGITSDNSFTLQMDMKGSKFVVGYSHGLSSIKIKRYNYVPTFIWGTNQSTLVQSYTGTERIGYRNNRIALRSNWDVFYSAEEDDIYQIRKINLGNIVSVLENSDGMVDVDINDKLLISKNYGTIENRDDKLLLYSNSDVLLHTYIADSKINNKLTSLAIYDCEFEITGTDYKYGGFTPTYSFETFHQLFNCEDCRPNMGATAVAKFKFPYQVNQVPSLYGLLDVTELCLVDNLLVDGSLSSCETGYYVGLYEFDPMTWTDIELLHSDWVYPLTQAPNNINIVDFLPSGYHLRPGKIYRFRLAVGNPWDSVDIFFEVSCCKREIIILEEDDHDYELEDKNSVINNSQENINKLENKIDVNVFPNPVKEVLNIESNHEKIVSYQINDVKGGVVLFKTITDRNVLKSIMVSQLDPGLYMLTLLDESGSKSVTKFVKK